MLIKPTASQDTDGGASIELTPIIDMVFLLLIFFLVATRKKISSRKTMSMIGVSSMLAPPSVS